jgi:hypothetical protein
MTIGQRAKKMNAAFAAKVEKINAEILASRDGILGRIAQKHPNVDLVKVEAYAKERGNNPLLDLEQTLDTAASFMK